jgi:hypothetical protein
MKDTFFTLIAILSLSALCFAQQLSTSAIVLRICKGRIESISVPNSKNGSPAEITALDEKGQRIKFVVKLGTVIFDKEDKAPSLDKIGKEANVIIEYSTTKDGINIAESIKSVE